MLAERNGDNWSFFMGMKAFISGFMLFLLISVIWFFSPSNPIMNATNITNLSEKPPLPVITAVISPPEQPKNESVPEQPKVEFINASAPVPKCLHGVIVTDWRGKNWCVLNVSMQDYKNQTAWIANQTSYNRSLNITKNQTYYVYFKENCTIVPEDYIWTTDAWLVNSTHTLTCEQVKAWQHNDAYH